MAVVNAERAKSEDYSKGFGEVTLDVEAEALFTKRMREEPGPRYVRLRRNAAGLLTMPPHITVTPEDGMRQPWTGNDRVDRNLFAMDRAIEVRQSGSRVMSRAHVGRTPAGDSFAAARAGKSVKSDRDRRKLVFPQVQEHQLAVEGEEEAVAHDRQMEATKNRRAFEDERREQQQAALGVRKIIQKVRDATADSIDELSAQLKQAQQDQLEQMGPREAQRVRAEADQALSRARAGLQA
jgi:hypothetical protein